MGSKYCEIKKYDIANGEGIRTSIFFSGCEHHCKGCFNKKAWNYDLGKYFTDYNYENDIKPTIDEHVKGITILGGEPFSPKNVNDLYTLLVHLKKDFPDKDIWVYTGYTYEELDELDECFNYFPGTFVGVYSACLMMIDVLVDGRFVEEKKDLSLKFKGSSNQRIIDVKESIRTNEVVLYYK